LKIGDIYKTYFCLIYVGDLEGRCKKVAIARIRKEKPTQRRQIALIRRFQWKLRDKN